MTLKFPKLQQWQQDIWEAITTEDSHGKVFCVKAKRQIGKSIIANILGIYFATNKQKTTSIIVEPTMPQCRRVYKQMQMWLQDVPNLVEKWNNSSLEITFENGSEIIFKSAEQRDRLRGFTVSGILIVDEAAFIHDDIIDIVLPWVDANNAPVLFISTPLFADGRYYTFYQQGLDPLETNAYSFDWALYDTSIFLSNEKLEFYRKTVSPLKFQSEYLGQFITDGSFVFKNITKCIKEPDITKSIPTYCGIDWGIGNSGDYTAITILDQFSNMMECIYFNDKDSVEQIKFIADKINSMSSLRCVQVELNSIGRVFYDNLKKKLRSKHILKGFNTSNDSKRYIIETLAAAFENTSITILDDAELIKQLQHYASEKTATGKLTYNGLSGYHDDLVMSLAIAYNASQSKTKYSILTSKK